jgi:cellulose biosynthesis protein BcsQ
MKVIAFFNSKSGVGKTTLVYHLAWMFSEMGRNVVAADLDPQSNLTSMFLDEDRLVELWPSGKHPLTIQGAVDPILRGIGDLKLPHIESITDRIGLLPGDLGLSVFEEKLSDAWLKCHNRDESAFRATTACYRAIRLAADAQSADLVLVDVGPNLGALNRSALIGSQYVVIPLGADLFSLQELRNLGPQLRAWRTAWNELRKKSPDPDLPLPSGEMEPVGYVVMQHANRADRPVKAYKRWMDRIPAEYSESVAEESHLNNLRVEDDPHCVARLRNYRSLMPLAVEARKPMFLLKPADGAIGAHGEAVRDCYRDFTALADGILKRVGA